MKRKLLLIYLIFPALVFSQSKDPKGQWYIQGNVGYAFSLENVDASKVSIVNDSVRSNEEYRTTDKSGSGININLEFLYKKKSGWHYSLGLNSFLGQEMEFIYANDYDFPYPITRTWNHKVQQQTLLIKVGIGYETTYKKRANVYTRLHLMTGGGWYSHLEGNGTDFTDYIDFRWGYDDTFLKTWGISLALGAELKLDRNWSALVHSELSIVQNTSLDDVEGTAGIGPYENPIQAYPITWGETNVSNHFGYTNISLSLGLRYKL